MTTKRRSRTGLKKAPPRIIDVGLTDATLRMALVQLEGPLPAAKVAAVNERGRETFSWASLDEVTNRQEKAAQIVRFVMHEHPDTDIIVFPEYSLPLELTLDRMRDLCDELGVILIPGADSFKGRGRTVHNKCPVLIPGRETVWVTKQNLSKWEEGKVDRPPQTDPPLFRWSHQEHNFYFAVSICLDFVTTIKDTPRGDDEPIVHIVPMCSPDMRTFREYSDLTLWEPGGRAVIMSNCTGVGSAGDSALFAVTPTGERGHPVLSLSSHAEEIVVFELHCDRLVPPRRTGKEPKVPVGAVFLYRVRSSADRVDITPMRRDEPANIDRGVLNPALFGYLGKQLRVSFLGIEGYGGFDKEKFALKAFELYSILGHHDIMVTHLHHSPEALIYDVNESVAWKLRTGLRADPSGSVSNHTLHEFPYFEVTSYHKVLGVPVPTETAAAFFLHPPSPDERKKLLDLGMDWDSKSADKNFRDAALRKKWILDTTSRDPGDIDAVMTIYLDYPTEIDQPLHDFDRRVVAQLVAEPTVTSLFGGVGQRMNVHYLLRLRAPRERLFAFIQQVHKAAEEANLVIATTTYVIVAKWSRLELREALMLPLLPADREGFRDHRIVPRINAATRALLINWPAEEQLELIATVERLLLAWDHLVPWRLTADQEHVEKELMVGLIADKTLDRLGELCHLFLGSVEDWAGNIIKERLSDDDFRAAKESAGVASQKEAHQLMLPEKFKVISALWKVGKVVPSDTPLPLVNDEELGRVRNAIAHREFARVGRNAIIETIVRCSEFLAWWAQNVE